MPASPITPIEGALKRCSGIRDIDVAIIPWIKATERMGEFGKRDP